MPRIPRVRGLPSLQLAIAPSTSSARTSFAVSRTISTTTAVQQQGKNTNWIRSKLWKGEAPGAEDPYTQRPEETEEVSNLPDEARDVNRQRRDRTPHAVQRSRLVLPPRRSEAVTPEELQSVDPSYAPASTLEDLGEVTSIKTWWEQPGHWGEESEFRGFARAEKVHDKEILEVHLRRAVVEALALRESGQLEQWVARKWPAGERSALDEALAVQIQVQDGKATLSGDVGSITARLTSEVEESGVVAEAVSVEEAREITKSWDASWSSLVLDEHLKFAVRKRLFQLTGNLIPDSKLGAAITARHLLTLVTKPPKREKLIEIVEARGNLTTLPNVTFHNRKITPIDKEVAVGRWKVIEEELKKRDLPVTGTNGMARNKEREWLSGRT